MPYEKSPSLEAYAEGLPPSPPPESSTRHRWLWVVILVLAAAFVGLVLINFMRSSSAELLVGTGTVTGRVVDEKNRPLEADIFVLRTSIEARSSEDGSFELQGVPAGQQAIVVAHQGAGREFSVVVVAGSRVDMGLLQLTATAVPQGE